MKIAAYNILAGGFNDYGSPAEKPERLALLQPAIQEIDADIIGLSDTFRWVNVFIEQDVKELFGYEYVSFINMNDVRVDKRIGVAVLSRIPVKYFETVRLATRDCIKAVVSIESKSIALYTAYLDDLAESVRVEQVQVLLGHIVEDKKQGIESIVMGDLNMLAPVDMNMRTRIFKDLFDAGIRIEEIFSDKPYYAAAIEELYKVEAMPLLSQAGLREPSGSENQLTAFTPIHDLHFPMPLFRLDHILHTQGVNSSEFLVHTGGIFEDASDHYPIACEIK